MSNEQINIAIAEACGWKRLLEYNGAWGRGLQRTYLLPDYCNDLNAMHQAERVLTPEQKLKYFNYFIRANTGFYDPEIIFSTARQRAKAFLRAIGKWEDGK